MAEEKPREEVHVHGYGNAKLFKTADDRPPIYILADGRFAALMGEKWVVKSTIKSLEKLSQEGRPTLKLFRADDGDPDVFLVVDVSDFLGSKIVDGNGKSISQWGNWYLYDEEGMKKLKQLAVKVKKFIEETDAKREKIEKELTAVGNYNFKRLLKESREAVDADK